jgi:hypothetical protein
VEKLSAELSSGGCIEIGDTGKIRIFTSLVIALIEGQKNA